jgi:hypothetical protein
MVRDMFLEVRPDEVGSRIVGSRGGRLSVVGTDCVGARLFELARRQARKERWDCCAVVTSPIGRGFTQFERHQMDDIAVFVAEAPNCATEIRALVASRMPDETLRLSTTQAKIPRQEHQWGGVFSARALPATPDYILKFWDDYRRATAHPDFFTEEYSPRPGDWHEQLLRLLDSGDEAKVAALERFMRANSPETSEDFFSRTVVSLCATPPVFEIGEPPYEAGLVLYGGLFHCTGGGPSGPLLVSHDEVKEAYSAFFGPIEGARFMASGRFYTPKQFLPIGPATIFNLMHRCVDAFIEDASEMPRMVGNPDDSCFAPAQTVLLPFAVCIPAEHKEALVRPMRAAPSDTDARILRLTQALERAVRTADGRTLRLTPISPVSTLIETIQDIKHSARVGLMNQSEDPTD